MTALWVFIGGGLGSLARYGVSLGLAEVKPANFPLGTFVANLLSCLIIGLLVYVFSEKITSEELKSFLVIGFCGGFSTFSTFSNETFTLFKDGNFGVAVLNIIISLVLCLGIIWLLQMAKK